MRGILKQAGVLAVGFLLLTTALVVAQGMAYYAGLTTTGQKALVVGPWGAAAGNTGESRFLELAASGANYTGFKSPDALAGDVVYTLPIADGTNGYGLTTNGSKVLAWSSFPVWVKFTKTYTDLSAAALTNNIEVYSLPAGTVIHAVLVKHSTLFSGAGITDYKVSVGIASDLTKFSGAFEVDTAVSGTNFNMAQVLAMESTTGATSIKLAATSVGANLSAASAGSVTVWFFVTLPG